MSASQYKATVMFVLFSAEEVQRQGSIAFAKWIYDDNVDVIGMINLDTIGNIHDFAGNREDRYLRVYSAGPNDARPRGGWRGKPTSWATITILRSACR